MRKDQGVSGDAQRIEQLGWMITLKILDDKDAELELLNDDYVSVIPEEKLALHFLLIIKLWKILRKWIFGYKRRAKNACFWYFCKG